MTCRKLIVFVGCQGAGKTTQAFLLLNDLISLGYNVCIASFIDYTIFHLKFIGLLGRLCRENTIRVKFYEDLPPSPSPSPEIYRRLFILLVLLHFVGFVISSIKRKFLKFLYQLVVEHEGYVFKQFVDIYFLAIFAKIRSKSMADTLLRRFSMMLLSALLKDKILVVHLTAKKPNILKKRYIKRPHVEPTFYLCFQEKMYAKLIEYLARSRNIDVVNVDCNLSATKVHQLVTNAVRRSLMEYPS
jgi:hypothetical protein